MPPAELTHAKDPIGSPTRTVSIVVPAFNQERGIRRTIESAGALTGATLDIVVVDDGSTDATPDVLRELARIHGNLRIISQPNQGPSAARNAGIDAARGGHIIFLDAGDELLPVDLSPLLTAADMHAFSVTEVQVDGSASSHREAPYSGSGPHYLRRCLREGTFLAVAWKYVYSAEFLRSRRLRFAHGLIHEDMLFPVEALLAADRVDGSDMLAYRYIRTPHSITTTYSREHIAHRLSSLDTIISRLQPLQHRFPDVGIDQYRVRLLRYANLLAARSGVAFAHPAVLRRRLHIGWLRASRALRLVWRRRVACPHA